MMFLDIEGFPCHVGRQLVMGAVVAGLGCYTLCMMMIIDDDDDDDDDVDADVCVHAYMIGYVYTYACSR